MSSSMRINVSLDLNPTIHLAPWKRAANQRASMLFTEYEPRGLLFEIAEDPVWNSIPENQLGGGQFRPRPTFDPPLVVGGGPAVRDATKLATKARMAHLGAKATLTSGLLDCGYPGGTSGCTWVQFIVPGALGGGQFILTCVADAGPVWGQNRAPKPPTWVAKHGWRLAAVRGVAMAGGGQHLFFRCTPLYPGTVKWGF